MSTENVAPDSSSNITTELKELDTLMRCGICFDYMNTAMLLSKCSHNYCSLCIRRSINYKQQCPMCLEPTNEGDLRNNRQLDDIIQLFSRIRPKLLDVIKVSDRSDVPSSGDQSEKISAPAKPASRSSVKPADDLKDSVAGSSGSPGPTSLKGSSAWSGFLKKPSTACKRSTTAPLLIDSDSDATVDENDGGHLAFESDAESEKSESASHGGPLAINETSCEDGDFEERWMTLKRKMGSKSTGDAALDVGTAALSTGAAALGTGAAALGMGADALSTGAAARGTGAAALGTGSAAPSMGAAALGVSAAAQGSSASGNAIKSPTAKTPESNKVPCPVCNVEIPAHLVNNHLDRCLLADQKKESLRRTTKRKPLTKLVYNLLADKDLKKKLAEVGLPITDRKANIERHREFTLRYNSECDAVNPKSAKDIVREMLAAENDKSKLSAAPSATQLFKLDKSSTPNTIETVQKLYVKTHKSQFDELIAAMKRNQEEKKKKASSSATLSSNENEASNDQSRSSSSGAGDQTDGLESVAQNAERKKDDAWKFEESLGRKVPKNSGSGDGSTSHPSALSKESPQHHCSSANSLAVEDNRISLESMKSGNQEVTAESSTEVDNALAEVRQNDEGNEEHNKSTNLIQANDVTHGYRSPSPTKLMSDNFRNAAASVCSVGAGDSEKVKDKTGNTSLPSRCKDETGSRNVEADEGAPEDNLPLSSLAESRKKEMARRNVALGNVQEAGDGGNHIEGENKSSNLVVAEDKSGAEAMEDLPAAGQARAGSSGAGEVATSETKKGGRRQSSRHTVSKRLELKDEAAISEPAPGELHEDSAETMKSMRKSRRSSKKRNYAAMNEDGDSRGSSDFATDQNPPQTTARNRRSKTTAVDEELTTGAKKSKRAAGGRNFPVDLDQ